MLRINVNTPEIESLEVWCVRPDGTRFQAQLDDEQEFTDKLTGKRFRLCVDDAWLEEINAGSPIETPTGLIAARVLRGAALLDEQIPDWAPRIDLRIFDMGTPWCCVLGQLDETLIAPDGRTVDKFSSSYGFDLGRDDDGATYELLNKCWSDVIASRLASTRK